jgi:hypothetical protein
MQTRTAHLIHEETLRLTSFEDIRIIGIDPSSTYKPDKSKDLFNVHLGLSSIPPGEWERFFDAERAFPRHTMWRRAWIAGPYIVINCVLSELEQYHLKDLKQDVAEANRKYRQLLTDEAKKRLASEIREHQSRNEVADLAERLEF